MTNRKLFLDTNIYVRAYVEKAGPSTEVMELAINGAVTVIASAHLVDEVSRHFRAEFGRQQAFRMRSMILAFPDLHVVDPLQWQPRMADVLAHTRDRTDAPHFAAARAGQAEAFVSYNRRSILAGMFDLVPLAAPEDVLPGLTGLASWPTKAQMEAAWRKWATGSRRAPR
jgi:putative PIN family toxin of toxin-antitoxin system